MKTLLVFNILIALLYICSLVSLLTAAGIGETSCRYLGEMEKNGKKCHEDVVKVHELPPKCTSFVYDGVICTPSYRIEAKDAMYGLERLQTLLDFDKPAKNVYLFYSHGGLHDWYDVLSRGNFKLVAQNVQNFVRRYPVKGLILNEIDFPYSNEFDGDFHQNFTDYVNTIRAFNSNLEIGLYLSARTFFANKPYVFHNETSIIVNNVTYTEAIGVYYYNWFYFPTMNRIMDFYIIEFYTFNECTPDLLRTGITPLKSSDPFTNSLNNFTAVLKDFDIDKEKLYFEFLISPKPLYYAVDNFTNCEISYNEYCENENNKKSKFCADDSEALYQKGKFTKANAKGFIGMYIDLVDRDDKCHCGKYMAFDMMVKRYNGETDPKDCEPLRGS
ncbi:uncharacterized protein LOC111026677 [Myzus persicae]|uniref:uncharacterized protein LOC111026677 n=1 Tax=Myzus persicae TaxID=13164 RepID=UPI000B9304B2|nr:uncharacterized protein LOC111026677 [Myzus persicae]